MYFHRVENPGATDLLLESLKARLPHILSGIQTWTTTLQVRVGFIDTSALTKRDALVIARGFDDHTAAAATSAGVVRILANEAARIEATLAIEDEEHGEILPVSEQALLLVLEAARLAGSTKGIAAKDLPEEIRKRSGRKVGHSRIPKLINALRERGFEFPEARGLRGYRLTRPLTAECAKLGIAYPTLPGG
jgi:hypothetical protein